ncbi:MAG: MarR family transcriptional regulator [Minisyncoccia bacterium]
MKIQADSGAVVYERFMRNLHKTVFMLDRFADRLLAEKMGGTFSQFMVLMGIAQCPGLSQQRIAEFLNLTPAAVSRQIDTLSEEGLIKREQDPDSRRSHVVNLTPAGTSRLELMKTTLLQSFGEKVQMPLAELERASKTMEDILQTMTPFEHKPFRKII